MKAMMTTAACLALALGGCQTDPRRCCDQYSPTEQDGRFCLAYRESVLRYVRQRAAPELRRQRLEKFKTFYKNIALTTDDDELNRAVQNCGLPEFIAQFNNERGWVSRDTMISIDRRAAIIKEGFQHAVFELEQELLLVP